MNEQSISNEAFRQEVEEATNLLRSKGFQRAPQFESETPTTCSVVYLGKNVAFTFELDVRDQGIDLIVTRHRDEKLVATLDGGYSSSLFNYLLKYCGFRGRPTPPASLPPTASNAQKMIAALVNLLSHPSSAPLLADQPDALPK